MTCVELQVALPLRQGEKGFSPASNKTLHGTGILEIPACGKAVKTDAKFVD